jgi:hypothetical protein
MEEGEIRRVVAALILIVCCALLGGCTKKSDRGTVTGTVTLDGEPLKSGAIHFVPADGRTAAADATITDGKYTVELPPGEKRVTISSPKVVGKRKMYETADSPTVDVVQELLPAKYNSKSDLTYTATAGSQEKDFPLTSGK